MCYSDEDLDTGWRHECVVERVDKCVYIVVYLHSRTPNPNPNPGKRTPIVS
jgi:hypothetical protein